MTYAEAYKWLVDIVEESENFRPASYAANRVLFNCTHPPDYVAFVAPWNVVFLFPRSWILVTPDGYCHSANPGMVPIPEWTPAGLQLHFDTLLEYYNAKPAPENHVTRFVDYCRTHPINN